MLGPGGAVMLPHAVSPVPSIATAATQLGTGSKFTISILCDLAQCGVRLGQSGLAMIVIGSLALIAAALYFGMCNCPQIIVRVTSITDG